jgi:bifunctional non-homologous end joining protein LigD
MVAFDLLHLNRYDLRKLPLSERKALLKKNIDGTDLQFSVIRRIVSEPVEAHEEMKLAA